METAYGYGYVRVSTEKQDELSPDSQAKLLKEYAHKVAPLAGAWIEIIFIALVATNLTCRSPCGSVD